MTSDEAADIGRLPHYEARVAYLEDYVEWHWKRGEIWHRTTLLAAGILGASIALLGKATDLPPAFSMRWLKTSWLLFLVQIGIGVFMSLMVPRVAAQMLNSKVAVLLGRDKPSPKGFTRVFIERSGWVELAFYMLFLSGTLGLVLAVGGKRILQLALWCQ